MGPKLLFSYRVFLFVKGTLTCTCEKYKSFHKNQTDRKVWTWNYEKLQKITVIN